jgi:hypothetical protein
MDCAITLPVSQTNAILDGVQADQGWKMGVVGIWKRANSARLYLFASYTATAILWRWVFLPQNERRRRRFWNGQVVDCRGLGFGTIPDGGWGKTP